MDSTTSTPPSSPRASVYAKLTQDKPVAIGFMDTPANASSGPAAKRVATAASEDPSGVVAAFMKSVGKKNTPEPADEQPVEVMEEEVEDQTPVLEVEDPTPVLEVTEAAAAEPAAFVASEPAAATEVPDEEEQTPVLEVTEAAALAEPTEESEAAQKAAEQTSDVTAEVEVELTAAAAVEVAAEDVQAQDTTLAAAAAAYSSPNVPSNNHSNSLGDTLSSRGRSVASPAASSRGSRPPSPGRGSSHVTSATAAAAMDWMAGVQSNGIVAAAREAEEAAKAKAARLEAAQKAASAAAAEAERLKHDMSSNVKGAAGTSSGMLRFKRGSEYDGAAVGSMAAAMPAPPEVMPTGRDQVIQ